MMKILILLVMLQPQLHTVQLQGVPLSRANIQQLMTLLRNGEVDLDDLIELTAHKHARTAFYAAWLMEDMLTRYADEFVDHWSNIVKYGAMVTNPSCHRHYMKIYSYFTNTKAPALVKAMIINSDMRPVIQQCFDQLTDPRVRVAVKVAAAETLCHLSPRYTWIANELSDQLNLLMQNGSPAILSAGRRLLNVLDQQKA
jgi:hypothetical protein